MREHKYLKEKIKNLQLEVNKKSELEDKFNEDIEELSQETENLVENSVKKLNQKYCDIIVANDVSKKETGFNVDYNKISIIEKDGKIENIPKNTKKYIAGKIAKKIIDKLLINDKNTN